MRVEREEARVLVGGVGEPRLASTAMAIAASDLRLVAGRDLAVAVLDRPVVVGPERGHLVGRPAARRAARCSTGCTPSPSPEMPLTRVNSGSPSCVLGVDRRGAEVVAQAERVADLVHRLLLEERGDEALDVRAVGVEVAAGLEQRQAEHRLAASRSRRTRRPSPAVRAPASLAVASRRRALGMYSERRLRTIAHVVRVDADVGVEDLAGPRVDDGGADRAERRCAPSSASAPTRDRARWCRSRRRRAAARRGSRPGSRCARTPCSTRGCRRGSASRYFSGMVRSSQKTIGCFGSDSVGGRILLLEPPAVDVARDRDAGHVAGEVEALGGEVADAVVGEPRAHRLFGQLRQRVVEAEEQAAHVGQRGGQRCAAGRGPAPGIAGRRDSA